MEEFEKIISKLKEKSYVISMPRTVIIKYLVFHRTHHTAESVYKEVSKEHPTISLATVYNTLKILVKEGFLTPLAIEGEKIFYDSTSEEHTHFLCKVCGKIKDVWLKPSMMELDTSDKIERINLFLYGVCEKCIEKEKETKR